MATQRDPIQALAMVLVRCRDSGRAAREQIAELETKLSQIKPPVAKTLVRIAKEIDSLDRDLTQLVEKLEDGSDPVRWFWNQGGAP
jgi:uncharacterized coiled-coil protein SlyX